MKVNNSSFSLLVNGSDKEVPLESLFAGHTGDPTAGIVPAEATDEAREAANKIIAANEELMLYNLRGVAPEGGKRIHLLVKPAVWNKKVIEPENNNSGFTATFDHLFFRAYANDLTERGVHIKADYPGEKPEYKACGYIHRDQTSAQKYLGIQVKGISEFKWEQIDLRKSFNGFSLFTTSLDYLPFGSDKQRREKRDKAVHTERKHDYVDYLLEGYAFDLNVSVNRVYACGFLYQLFLGTKLGGVIRDYHINKAKVRNESYQILRQSRREETQQEEQPVSPKLAVPALKLTHHNPKLAGKVLLLDESNLGRIVQVYKGYQSPMTVPWDGSVGAANTLSTFENCNLGYSFDLI